ncbi:GKN1 protein, partial [Corythaixoides concolor]|nr:GKN1 protein [Corythaixoides concolor]
LFALLIERLLGTHKLNPSIFFKNQDGRKHFKRHHGEHSHESFIETGINSDSGEDSDAWNSVWDTKTGYVATKVFSKNTCIIAKLDERFLHNQPFPEQPQGEERPGPDQLPPIENRYIISGDRLQSLRPYGRRIEALCRGIPSYLAYPAAGEYSSNSALC